MEKYYRAGRYFWRGPKKGTEEPDAVEVGGVLVAHLREDDRFVEAVERAVAKETRPR